MFFSELSMMTFHCFPQTSETTYTFYSVRCFIHRNLPQGFISCFARTHVENSQFHFISFLFLGIYLNKYNEEIFQTRNYNVGIQRNIQT